MVKFGRYGFVMPALFIISFLILFPLFYGFWVSLYKDLQGGTPLNFIGLGSYLRVLASERFLKSVGRTIYYTAASVGVKVIIGLVAALLLNREFWGRGAIRGVMIIPWTIPAFVVALIWYWMTAWSGMLNTILRLLNLSPIQWLGPAWAMTAVIIVNIWKGFPFYMMGLLAGLQGIPEELYEAAEVDGASSWNKFWHITIPGLKPVLLTVVLLSTIWTFSEFVTVYLITKGGPGTRTETIPILIFSSAYEQFNLNLAAAMSIMVLPIFLILIFFIVRMLRG